MRYSLDHSADRDSHLPIDSTQLSEPRPTAHFASERFEVVPIEDAFAKQLSTFPSESDLSAGSCESATRLQETSPPGTRVTEGPPHSWRLLTRLALGVLLLLTLGQTLALAVLLRSRATTPADGGSLTVTSTSSGALTVTSTPSGATVLVDEVSAGVTPVTTTVGAGTHQVAIRHPGGVSTHSVDVAAGASASLHFELGVAINNVPTPTERGDLQITTEPTGATVAIDGRRRGVAPVRLTDLAPGQHSVTVSHAGNSVTRAVSIQPGTLSSLVIHLNSEQAPGWLSVSSSVPVRLYEKGILLGNSETPRIMLSAGRHVLDLSNPELGLRTQRSVEVRAGQTTRLAMEVPNGTVAINALPWAEVWIGGRSLGETPLANVSLPLGSHELVFKHPTLGEQRKTVVVTMGSTVRVGLDLRKGTR